MLLTLIGENQVSNVCMQKVQVDIVADTLNDGIKSEPFAVFEENLVARY
jgi:hypothetical protein